MNELQPIEITEEFPIPEMELWWANVTTLDQGQIPNPHGHLRHSGAFCSQKDAWEFRCRFAKFIVEIHGEPFRTSLEECFAVARAENTTTVVIRRGDGSIIDWWEVK